MPKTFNKDKKVAWGKECPSNNILYINKKKMLRRSFGARWYKYGQGRPVAVAMPQIRIQVKVTVEVRKMRRGFIPR